MCATGVTTLRPGRLRFENGYRPNSVARPHSYIVPPVLRCSFIASFATHSDSHVAFNQPTLPVFLGSERKFESKWMRQRASWTEEATTMPSATDCSSPFLVAICIKHHFHKAVPNSCTSLVIGWVPILRCAKEQRNNPGQFSVSASLTGSIYGTGYVNRCRACTNLCLHGRIRPYHCSDLKMVWGAQSRRASTPEQLASILPQQLLLNHSILAAFLWKKRGLEKNTRV